MRNEELIENEELGIVLQQPLLDDVQWLFYSFQIYFEKTGKGESVLKKYKKKVNICVYLE